MSPGQQYGNFLNLLLRLEVITENQFLSSGLMMPLPVLLANLSYHKDIPNIEL